MLDDVALEVEVINVNFHFLKLVFLPTHPTATMIEESVLNIGDDDCMGFQKSSFSFFLSFRKNGDILEFQIKLKIIGIGIYV